MSLIKNGALNVFVYGCGLIVVNGLSFLMLPFYTRQFQPSEYALITLIITIVPLTRYCLPLEICQAAPIFSADDQSKKTSYISTGLLFTLFMNLVCYTIVYLLNTIFHFIHLTPLHLLSLVVLLIVDCLYYFASNILRWELKYFSYNAIISAIAILETILTVIFVLLFKLSVFGIFYSWLLSRSLGFLLTFSITRNLYRRTFDLAILKKMLHFSFPLFLSNIPYNLNRSFDRWMIAAFIGLSAVGIYGAGSTISGIFGFIMASLSSALTPLVYKNHAKQGAPIEIVKMFYLTLSVCLTIAIFFSLFNKEILNLFVSKLYYDELVHQPIVSLFVLSAILAGINIFSPGLSIKKKTVYVVWFNVISLVLNAALSLLLIFKFGIVGVAFSTCVSVLINTVLYMMVSQRYYYLPLKSNHLVPLLLIFTTFYAGAIWVGMQYRSFELEGVMIRLIYCFIVFGIISGLALRAYRKISLQTHDKPLPSYNYS